MPHLDQDPAPVQPTNNPAGSRPTQLLLLVTTGTLLGLSTILAKLASGANVPAMPFLIGATGGAAGLLIWVAAIRGHLPVLDRRTIEYFILAGLFSFAAANLLLFSAVPYVGAGFAALAIAFPPVLTYIGAILLRIDRLSILRAAGVMLALSGALILAISKVSAADAPPIWIAATLAAPLLLAAGNLYRTLRWPPGAQADALAPGMLAASCLLLLVFASLAGLPIVPTDPSGHVLVLIAIQSLVFAVQYLLFFELQKRAGPVFLSLLGSVAAIVGVPLAVFLLGEGWPGNIIPAAVLILIGIALVSRR